MIAVIVRTGFKALRRDRGAFLLSFILPIAFFNIFAVVMGGMGSSSTARVSVLVVDEDHSAVSERLVGGLRREPSLVARTRPATKKGQPVAPEYTAATAEAAVKQGVAAAALIIPKGFGANPVAFGPGTDRQPIRILHDSSDPVAAQVVAGLLQKVVMTSLPDAMAGEGMKYFEQASRGLTPRQRQEIEANLSRFRDQIEQRDQEGNAPAADSGNNAGGLVAVDLRDVVGENKRSPMIAFSAAGIGVMFLLFTASASAGSLLDEAENGASTAS